MTFLVIELQIEKQQCIVHSSFPLQRLTSVLRHQLLLEVSQIKGTQTSEQLADLKVKCTALQNRIQRWHETQLVYMLCVGTLLMQTLTTVNSDKYLLIEPAKDIGLHLPSSLLQNLR